MMSGLNATILTALSDNTTVVPAGHMCSGNLLVPRQDNCSILITLQTGTDMNVY
jgi:hypothetical protein